MEQPIQQPNNPIPPVQPQQPQPQYQPQPQPAQKTSSGLKIFLWILGGCLVFFLIIMVVIAALGWWGIRTAKNELEKSQPQIEQWSKDMQKQAEDMQKQTEQLQKSLPTVPTEDIPSE